MGGFGLVSTALMSVIFYVIVKVISSVSNISVSNAVPSSIVARISVSSSDIVVLLASICSNSVCRVAVSVFLSLGASSLSRMGAILPKIV